MFGGLAGLARLAERVRPWAELVSVQAGECVCVFFKPKTKVALNNSNELIKTPQ
jgi:hypothetical protein